MTPGSGASDFELLREVREHLAASDAADQLSIEHLERAAALRKVAAAHRARAEQRIAAELRAAEAVEFPPARAPRRPRLEEGSPRDRERALKVIAALLRDPEQTDHRIGTLAGVHHSVVARIRRDHFGGKSRGKSPDAQVPGGKPFSEDDASQR